MRHSFTKTKTIRPRPDIRPLAWLLCMALWLGTPLRAQHPAAPCWHTSVVPKREVRAIWLTTIGGIDWPHSYAQSSQAVARQQAELRLLLDQYQKAGINTILLQTRIRGTMIYPSAYEPWDGCLSGKPGSSPGYDALAFAIDECHRRGMELHAWVVTIPVGKWNALGCRRLRQRFPNLIRKIGPDGYMNPEMPQTAHYLADLCEEITRNYDIDGIHLDYIRYPENWNIRVSRAQARNYITGIVREIHRKVKLQKPWVKLSCSPIGKFDDLSRYWSHGWNAYTKVAQDAQGWLRDGLMDALFPMMYFRNDQFFPFAIDWAERSYGKMVAPGLGIYFLSPREGNWSLGDITREMQVLRQYGMGHAYFRGKFFTDNTKGIYTFAKNEFDRYPALVPAMTWQHGTAPTAPTRLTADQQTHALSWSGARDRSDAPYLLYNVYASRTYPVDVSDARNLIAMRLRQPRFNAAPNHYYAVTAMDRYGNESPAIQQERPQTVEEPVATGLLDCDNSTLSLPRKSPQLDAGYLIIEDMQGKMVSSRPYNSDRINVKSLTDGMYAIRSVNKKGITHRIGIFMIRRTV